MRTVAGFAVVAAGLAVVATGSAAAATVIQPTGVPTVPANAPLTVVATGFVPGEQVFVEQCDGISPFAPGWSPTLHCDLGTSPAPAIADAQGRAAFDAGDENRAFRPFEGESPQSLFNCMSARHRAPKNALASFTNCQVRVSSNNTVAAPDQVFFPILLSGAVAATGSTTTPSTRHPSEPSTRPAQTATAKSSAGSASTAGTSDATHARSPDRVAVLHAPAKSSGGAGLLAFSDPGVRAGYLLVIVGLFVAFGPTLAGSRRRIAPTPGPGYATAESG